MTELSQHPSHISGYQPAELATLTFPGWIDPRRVWLGLAWVARKVGASGEGTEQNPFQLPTDWCEMLGSPERCSIGLAYSRNENTGELQTHVVLWHAAAPQSKNR
jgi:hypothetical protein